MSDSLLLDVKDLKRHYRLGGGLFDPAGMARGGRGEARDRLPLPDRRCRSGRRVERRHRRAGTCERRAVRQSRADHRLRDRRRARTALRAGRTARCRAGRRRADRELFRRSPESSAPARIARPIRVECQASAGCGFRFRSIAFGDVER